MPEMAKRKVREWEEHVQRAESTKADVEALKSKKRKGGTKGMSYFLQRNDSKLTWKHRRIGSGHRHPSKS
jgi:hypothetical protein